MSIRERYDCARCQDTHMLPSTYCPDCLPNWTAATYEDALDRIASGAAQDASAYARFVLDAVDRNGKPACEERNGDG